MSCKINVIIPSRKRPESLKAVLRALQASASGQHEITYAVSFGRDDLATEAAAFSVPGVRALQHPKDCTLGAAFNNAVERLPWADVYAGFSDDVFPLTWCWDVAMDAALRHPAVMWCWQEATDPQNTTYVCCSSRVRRAIGRLYPEYFPYWFADLWLAEIHHFAFGFRPPLLDGLRLCGQRGKTQGFRDFAFWCRVFAYTRPERIRAAIKLAAEYGTQPPDMRGALAICRLFDADFATKADRFTTQFGSDAEPEPHYVLAKQRAEAMLAEKAA